MTDAYFGYAGQLLRVDLSSGDFSRERLTPEFAAKWVGGTGLGAKILFDEVPAGVEWKRVAVAYDEMDAATRNLSKVRATEDTGECLVFSVSFV